MVKRGRPPTLDSLRMKSCILNHYKEIITTEGHVVVSSDDIWKVMCDELDLKPTQSRAVHTFVSCDRYDIKKELLLKAGILPVEDKDNTFNESLDISNIEQPLEDSVTDTNEKKFMIKVPKEQWLKLITIKNYNKKYKGKEIKKKCRCLIPGEWTNFITNLVWSETKIECGFNFKNHYVPGGNTGYINGTCKCTSSLHIDIDERDMDVVFLHCTVTGKESSCKCKKSEYVSSKHLHKDPIISICKMKAMFPNLIHRIGQDPFYVYYWTSHQRNFYNTYAAREVTEASIVVSGKMSPQFIKASGELSGPIIIYLYVVNCSAGQFAVSQMMSEKHTTEDIANWLTAFELSGAARPKILNVDGSEAIMNACARVCTNCESIYEYADECKNLTPRCWIRNNIAHTIKNWACFMNKNTELKRVKVFYLATIGSLIRSTNLKESEAILRALFLISQVQTRGNLPSKQITVCEQQIKYLEEMITTELNVEANEILDDIPLIADENLLSTCVETQSSKKTTDNYWFKWASNIHQIVIQEIAQAKENDDGEEPNDYICDTLPEYLLSKMSLYPVWSNFENEKFGYSHNKPGSSTVVFENGLISRTRVDEALEKHCKYLQGHTNIALAHILEEEQDEEQNDVEEQLIHKNHTSLPIIKNGSDLGINYDGKKVTLTNTCHADSIFQILLAGVTDYPAMKKNVERLEGIGNIFECVLYASEHGITANSYILRANMLCSEFEEVNGSVNCQADIGDVAKKLFANTPSYQESYKCQKNCEFSDEYILSTSSRDKLKDLARYLKEEVFLDKITRLHMGNCNATATLVTRNIGDIFICEIFTIGPETQDFPLKDLPRFIKDPTTQTEFSLIGVVIYKGPSVRLRHTDDNIGHYSAIALRQNQWFEYDDTKAKEKKVSSKLKVAPSLVIFARV